MAWKNTDSEELYNVPNWSGGFFRIGEHGNVEAVPDGKPGDAPAIDMHRLIKEVQRRGIRTPLLMRFDGILRARVREIWGAFEQKIKEYEFPGEYRGVFPIKVNQQRHVVETMLTEGEEHGLGIEVGSKPELLAAVALKTKSDMLLICNGYKDRDYIETALLASRLGFHVVIVIEKFTELGTILGASQRLGIRPAIGVRTKLWGKGAGRWMESGGDRSKFGLTTAQIVSVVETLTEVEMLDCLELLHFHIGSQVTQIRSIKNALREATRTLVSLSQMGVHIRWFDVGGGLGIDYDGSRSTFESSMNYSLLEYADDVVFHLNEACVEAQIPFPTIVTESGRALTAHHAVLVTEVLGSSDYASVGSPVAPEDLEHELIHSFAEVYEDITPQNYHAAYHDAQQFRDEAMVLFTVGQLDLRERARIEEFYWRICQRILEITRNAEFVPDDLDDLERDLADTYFLNFSVFQSLPDSWAIQQLFPIMPLHRHGHEPKRRAILADITCDSDGKIDRFIDMEDVKRTLEVHELLEGKPYYLGIFLVGAYQEILGDMHNLFGDPNIVHVDLDTDGKPRLTHVVRGDRTEEVLSYVEYFEGDLIARLRKLIEEALARGQMTLEESAQLQRRYEAGLSGYTYLGRDETYSDKLSMERAIDDAGEVVQSE